MVVTNNPAFRCTNSRNAMNWNIAVKKGIAEIFYMNVQNITHLAMAGQRILEGKEEKPLDGQILETVKQEPVYGSALDFLTYMLNQTDLEFPDTEKDFLTVHLCNLFM